tara:strand:+ start:1608 stop:2759 length:1152 start_codon:yes stop_codon:yes gene_type:complete
MEFLKFLGKNAKSKFYARDFRNNYRFRPDVNPPRIKFEGYVNFVFNRDLASFLGMENNTYKTNISSLVRRAQLPTVNFKNITKNQYNKKRIVSTGVEFAPVEITVFDTLNNEWLQLLMRYFSYLYMNPRNKNDVGDRDVHMNTPAGLENNSEFGGTSFKSGEAGLNLQRDKQFFERIDIIMYHGGKGVQYSLTGPLLNSFSMGDIDYSSNEFVEFTMNIEYENFTTFDIANFDLGAVDLDRFEKVNGLDFASDEVMIKPLGILGSGSEMEFLGQHDNNYGTRGRTVQPQLDPIQYDTNTGDVITTGKKEDTTAKASTYDAIDNPFSLDPSKNILKGLLNTAVLSKLTGNDVSDSVKNYTLTAITRAATDKMADVQDAPERGDS